MVTSMFVDEESPDSREKWCWLIASQGNLRDSATENIPLIFLSKGEMVR